MFSDCVCFDIKRSINKLWGFTTFHIYLYIFYIFPKQFFASPCVKGQELFSLSQSYQMLSPITACCLSDAWEFHVIYSDSAECKLSFYFKEHPQQQNTGCR